MLDYPKNANSRQGARTVPSLIQELSYPPDSKIRFVCSKKKKKSKRNGTVGFASGSPTNCAVKTENGMVSSEPLIH